MHTERTRRPDSILCLALRSPSGSFFRSANLGCLVGLVLRDTLRLTARYRAFHSNSRNLTSLTRMRISRRTRAWLRCRIRSILRSKQ